MLLWPSLPRDVVCRTASCPGVRQESRQPESGGYEKHNMRTAPIFWPVTVYVLVLFKKKNHWLRWQLWLLSVIYSQYITCSGLDQLTLWRGSKSVETLQTGRKKKNFYAMFWFWQLLYYTHFYIHTYPKPPNLATLSACSHRPDHPDVYKLWRRP